MFFRMEKLNIKAYVYSDAFSGEEVQAILAACGLLCYAAERIFTRGGGKDLMARRLAEMGGEMTVFVKKCFFVDGLERQSPYFVKKLRTPAANKFCCRCGDREHLLSVAEGIIFCS